MSLRASGNRRAVKVCRNCHERKVKCDVHFVGTPCTRCKENAEECEMRGRKPYKPRKKNSEHLIRSAVGDSRIDDARPGELEDRVTAGDTLHPQHDPTGYIRTESQPPSGPRTIAIGNCASFQVNLLLDGSAPALQPEDLKYLELKGCFSLPDAEINDKLFRAYFEHFHPWFPILNEQEALTLYSYNDVSGTHLLLLWSMFSVASSYLEDATVTAAGFLSKTAMKAACARRAKLLFDLGGAQSRTLLLQSALLLSFWRPETEEARGSWYWSGIAISIAQAIQLDRMTGPYLSDALYQLRRRLWWSCIIRETWLAAALDTVPRLSLPGHDYPRPQVHDMKDTFELAVTEHGLYEGVNTSALAEYFICLTELTQVVNHILLVKNRPTGLQLTQHEVGTLGKHIEDLFEGLSADPDQSDVDNVFFQHLSMHRDAAIVLLYRSSVDAQTADQEAWRALANNKIRAAALRSNSSLEIFLKAENVHLVSPMVIPLVVPIIHSHLVASKSDKAVSQELGSYYLDLGLRFLTAMKHVYPDAGVVYGTYLKAKESDGVPNHMEERRLLYPLSSSSST